MKKFTVIGLAVLFIGSALTGCERGTFENNDGPQYVGSPHGYVPLGSQIVSPNGCYLARVDPIGISVFRAKADGESMIRVWIWPLGRGVKGVAWNPDSTKVAVMKHYGENGAISKVLTYRVFFPIPGLRHTTTPGYRHGIRYDEDGTIRFFS